MPIAGRTATSGTFASGATGPITLPTGFAVGDFIVLAVSNAGTTGPNAPAGWTRRYSASTGTGQNLAVFTAPYSAGLTLTFTNAASVAAWVCNNYWMSGVLLDYDTYAVATSTTNNATVPTGAPTTGAIAGDYEVLLYSWSSNATLASGVSGTTIDKVQANSNSITAAIGHNNTTSLGVSTATSAFNQTISGNNSRKAGVGLLIKQVHVDLPYGGPADPFNTLDTTTTWTVWGTGSTYINIGSLTINPSGVQNEYGGVYSKSTYDMTGKMCVVEWAQTPNYVPGAQGYMRLEVDGSNGLIFGFDSGNMFVQQQVAGTNTTLATISWPAVRAMRIYFDATGIYFEYDVNGAVNNWIVVCAIATPPIAITALRVVLGSGTYGTQYPSGVRYESINLPILSYQTIYTGTATGRTTGSGVMTRRRPLAGAAFGHTGGPYPNTVLEDGPYSYWRLDEASGSTASDASGNGHPATITAWPNYGQPGGVGYGTSIELQGNLTVLDVTPWTAGTLDPGPPPNRMMPGGTTTNLAGVFPGAQIGNKPGVWYWVPSCRVDVNNGADSGDVMAEYSMYNVTKNQICNIALGDFNTSNRSVSPRDFLTTFPNAWTDVPNGQTVQFYWNGTDQLEMRMRRGSSSAPARTIWFAGGWVLSFNWLTSPYNSLFDGAKDWSIETWIKVSYVPPGGDIGIFVMGEAQANDQLIHILVRGTTPCLNFWSDDCSSSTAVTPNIWHHLVFTFEGSTTRYQRIYLDGVQTGSRQATTVPNIPTGAWSKNLIYHGYYNNSWDAPRGFMDDYAIYAYALSSTQVLQHYTDGPRVSETIIRSTPHYMGTVNAVGSSFPSATISKYTAKYLGSVSANSGSFTTAQRILARRSITGAAPGAATVSATIIVGRTVRGTTTATGVSTNTGLVTDKRSLVGTSTGLSTAAATTPTRRRSLTGSSLGGGTEVGQPSAKRSLQGAATNVSTGRFVISGGQPIQKFSSTAVPGTYLSRPGWMIPGSPPGTLTGPKNITATATGIGTASAQVTTKRLVRDPIGSATGIATTVAQPARRRPLSGVTAGVSTVSAQLSRYRFLTGAATSTTTVTSFLTARRSLQRTIQGVATTTGQVGVRRTISGGVAMAAAGTSAVAAIITARRTIQNTVANGRSTTPTVALVGKRAILGATAAGQSTTAGYASDKRLVRGVAISVGIGTATVPRIYRVRDISKTGVETDGLATTDAWATARRSVQDGTSTGRSTTFGVINKSGALVGLTFGRSVAYATINAGRAIQEAEADGVTTVEVQFSKQGYVTSFQYEPIHSTESANVFESLRPVAASDTSKIQGLASMPTQAYLPGIDTDRIVGTEAVTLRLGIPLSDSNQLGSTELAVVRAQPLGSDANLVGGTEDGSPNAALPGVDYGRITSVESGTIAGTPVSGTDQQEILGTEVASPGITTLYGDHTAVGSTEAAVVAASVIGADQERLGSLEAVTYLRTNVFGSDAGSITGAEVGTGVMTRFGVFGNDTDVLISAITNAAIYRAVTASDTAQIAGVEAIEELRQAPPIARDTSVISGVATVSFVTQISFSFIESTKLAGIETATVQVQHVVTDQGILKSTETKSTHTEWVIDDETTLQSEEDAVGGQQILQIHGTDATRIRSRELGGLSQEFEVSDDSTVVGTEEAFTYRYIYPPDEMAPITPGSITSAGGNGPTKASGSNPTNASGNGGPTSAGGYGPTTATRTKGAYGRSAPNG